ncbi:hypothetical protein EGW08_008432 [Elysia chlorotica]|uniref:HD domain-containing protein n=1 Tax=Elysia chlorotica TaxID=188477 RepID=A0A3S1BAM7_ELYCH|nr:hypothetical protein EGW08_008432 [Elysia chlorotica]
METIRSVHKDWTCLMTNIGAPGTVSRDWWDIISRRYGEEWRFYHTLSHIHHMLQLYHQWKERIAECSVVALAIFFHDVVYDPQAKNNETQSIALFEKFALDAQLEDDIVSRVSHLIKCTISHVIDSDTDDLDLSLFLDFDLAVLGQDSRSYKRYAEAIRKEYIHVDDKSYRKGRTKVLRSLLDSPSLFASEEFRAEYEEKARANMLEEIDFLATETSNLLQMC